MFCCCFVVMFDFEQMFAKKYNMWNMLTSLWCVHTRVTVVRTFSRAFFFLLFSFFFVYLCFLLLFLLCVWIWEPGRFLLNENTPKGFSNCFVSIANPLICPIFCISGFSPVRGNEPSSFFASKNKTVVRFIWKIDFYGLRK